MDWNQYVPNPTHSSNPLPKSGYGYQLGGKNWRRSKDDSWDIVVLDASDAPGAKLVGRRNVDGSEIYVWKTKDGRYIGQMVVYAR